MILASLRHLPYEVERLKHGQWHATVGTRLFGRTLLHGLTVGWAAALALGATVAGRVFRQRPALTHGLWLLVLLKLVTPSLVHHTPHRDTGPTTIEPAAPWRPVGD